MHTVIDDVVDSAFEAMASNAEVLSAVERFVNQPNHLDTAEFVLAVNGQHFLARTGEEWFDPTGEKGSPTPGLSYVSISEGITKVVTF